MRSVDKSSNFGFTNGENPLTLLQEEEPAHRSVDIDTLTTVECADGSVSNF